LKCKQARIVVELCAAYSESEASSSKLENPDTDVHLSAWDWDAEAHFALERYEMLGAKFDVVSASIPHVNTPPMNINPMLTSTPTLDANSHICIHKHYPRFEPMDQYDYREELEVIITSLSSPHRTFPSSQTPTQSQRLALHRALYALKAPLREAWRAIQVKRHLFELVLISWPMDDGTMLAGFPSLDTHSTGAGTTWQLTVKTGQCRYVRVSRDSTSIFAHPKSVVNLQSIFYFRTDDIHCGLSSLYQ
jgi:hypothetical protein